MWLCRLSQIDGDDPEPQWVEVYDDRPGYQWAWWIGQLAPRQAPDEIFRVHYPYYSGEPDVVFRTVDQFLLWPLHYRCRHGVMHAVDSIDTFPRVYYR